MTRANSRVGGFSETKGGAEPAFWSPLSCVPHQSHSWDTLGELRMCDEVCPAPSGCLMTPVAVLALPLPLPLDLGQVIYFLDH